MDEQTVAVTVIIMAGLLLAVVAWQLLAVARDGVRSRAARAPDLERDLQDLRRRVDALERKE